MSVGIPYGKKVIDVPQAQRQFVSVLATATAAFTLVASAANTTYKVVGVITTSNVVGQTAGLGIGGVTIYNDKTAATHVAKPIWSPHGLNDPAGMRGQPIVAQAPGAAVNNVRFSVWYEALVGAGALV